MKGRHSHPAEAEAFAPVGSVVLDTRPATAEPPLAAPAGGGPAGDGPIGDGPIGGGPVGGGPVGSGAVGDIAHAGAGSADAARGPAIASDPRGAGMDGATRVRAIAAEGAPRASRPWDMPGEPFAQSSAALSNADVPWAGMGADTGADTVAATCAGSGTGTWAVSLVRAAIRAFGASGGMLALTGPAAPLLCARVGLPGPATRHDLALCALVLESDAAELVVDDPGHDRRLRRHPLVRQRQGLRFLAGAKLTAAGGAPIGAICILDTVPRAGGGASGFSASDRALLGDIARLGGVLAQAEGADDDPVTGLPGRTAFLAALDRMRTQAVAEATPLAPAEDTADDRHLAVLIELVGPDDWREVMRALGLPCVDDLVRSSTFAVAQFLGARTTLFHVGAGTIGFLLPGGTADAAARQDRLEALLARLQRPVVSHGVPIQPHPCIGIAPFPPGGAEPSEILRQAFAATQDARTARLRWASYSSDTDQAHRRAFSVLANMPDALAAGDQLSLVFQPRVDAATGRCVTAEALLRWRHPELGIVSPGEFIPLVEQTALIRPLTDWVLEAALAQSRAWRGAGLDLRVSVNASTRNLDEEDFVDRLAEALRRHGVDPRHIELEFTEGALPRNGAQARCALQGILSMGIEIAIDDFGTGFSNFSHLQEIPAGVLKLDQSLIRALPTSRRDQVIVRATTAMAHDLGYRVVAEGVETGDILDMVTAWGCDEMQGYFISRPMPAEALAQWVAQRQSADHQAG